MPAAAAALEAEAEVQTGRRVFADDATETRWLRRAQLGEEKRESLRGSNARTR